MMEDLDTPHGSKIASGVFNGQNMIAENGETYSVPANYSSKSRLVEGDKLQCYLDSDNNLKFKQIFLVPRFKLLAEATIEGTEIKARVGLKLYKILPASVTYYKILPKDVLAIIVPAHGNPNWCAVDNVIRNH